MKPATTRYKLAPDLAVEIARYTDQHVRATMTRGQGAAPVVIFSQHFGNIENNAPMFRLATVSAAGHIYGTDEHNAPRCTPTQINELSAEIRRHL
jgi:hypothetical protein